MPVEKLINEIYLPFSEVRLSKHFAPVAGGLQDIERHLTYYSGSASRYATFLENGQYLAEMPLKTSRWPCQIEKDERFWVVACLMTYYYSDDRTNKLGELLSKVYGATPPVQGLRSWDECLTGQLDLFFEVNLPSPKTYLDWLRKHVKSQHFVPYVLAAAAGVNGRLEGATHLDAMLLNSSNGFAICIEAKALSDISTSVSFDVTRNQLARTIDVMLEENPKLQPPLNGRRSDRSVFLLLTPRIFKEFRHSRLYGWLLDEYKREPSALNRDLPHRSGVDWTAIAERIGWLTWEDAHDILPSACRWLEPLTPEVEAVRSEAQRL